MPMSGNNYVAPTWVNGGPPALDAAELQAMCDTIEASQSEIVNLQSTAVSGTYTGNGNGSQYISLGFRPTAVLVSQSGGYWQWTNYTFYAGLAVYGKSASNAAGTGVSVSSNGFIVYNAESGNYDFRMNNSGSSYNYVAWKGANS